MERLVIEALAVQAAMHECAAGDKEERMGNVWGAKMEWKCLVFMFNLLFDLHMERSASQG